MEEYVSKNRGSILRKVTSLVARMDMADITPELFQETDLLLCKMMYKIEFHNYPKFDY